MNSVGQGWRLVALAALLAACDGGGGTEAPVATSLVAASATTQTGIAGAAVAEAPSVRVTDQDGRPMQGVAVNFQVLSGGGTVTGGSATTNASGVASATRWTLGASAGQNTLSATAGSLTPVVFTATAQDPCDLTTPYTLLGTVSGALSTQDCRLDTGEYEDFYSLTLPSAQAISFSMSSTVFDTYLLLYDATGRPQAINDDASATNTNSTINVFAPSGNYFLGASSYDPAQTGAYQISSAAHSGNVNCGEYWILPGVQFTGQITATDCNFDGILVDEYLVVLRPGQTLTVQMTSTAMDAALYLFASDGTLAASDDDGAGGTNALLTYTATELDVFYLDATSFSGTATGSYELTVTRSGADMAGEGSAGRDGTVRPRVERGARRLPALDKPAGR